jgi:hypothetical protein
MGGTGSSTARKIRGWRVFSGVTARAMAAILAALIFARLTG